MTLYLVKWQDGTSALIRAEDADHLTYLLDQLADPGIASWQVYDGPLWLEFPRIGEELPTSEDEIDPFAIDLGSAKVAETDWGGDFQREMLRLLHPTVAALRDRAGAEERPVPRAELDAAVEADLAWGLAGSVFGEPEGPPQ